MKMQIVGLLLYTQQMCIKEFRCYELKIEESEKAHAAYRGLGEGGCPAVMT